VVNNSADVTLYVVHVIKQRDAVHCDPGHPAVGRPEGGCALRRQLLQRGAKRTCMLALAQKTAAHKRFLCKVRWGGLREAVRCAASCCSVAPTGPAKAQAVYK
jgi:hypothetical protein